MNLYFYPTSTSLLSSLRKFLALFFVAIFSFGYTYAQVPARGLSFDGIDDYVNISVKPALNISSAITLEAWIFPRTTDGSGVQDVVCKSSADVNDGYVFPRTTDGWNNLEFLVSINGFGWQLLSVPYGLSKLNQWHHLAATYDGFEMRIYIDGVLAGSKLFVGTIAVNNNPLVISGQTGFFNEYFRGSVDEVRVWSRALTQCEIAQTMSCELPAGQNGLAAYYKFNNGFENADNTGLTQVVDDSGNGANGSLTNFALTGAISNWASGNVSGTCGALTSVSATATSTPAILAANGNVQLSATGGGANGTYAWTGPNGFTSTLQNPVLSTVNKNHSGTYNVVVNNNGCQATASASLTVADLGSALNFNGVNNFITVPNNPSFNSTKNLAIEAWVYPTGNAPVIQDVITNSTNIVNNGFILRTDDGWTNFSFWLHVNGQWRAISAPFPGLNQWHHIAATYDGFFMKIYLDGALSNTLSIAGTITTNSNTITIGQQDGLFEYFNGSLDELRVWSKALTQCEIQNNLNCQLSGKVNAANPLGLASQTGLAAYYRFNQGLAAVDNNSLTALSGVDINALNILADSSANHNNGTLHGFTLNGVTSNWIVGGAVNNSTCGQFSPSTATVISNGPIIEVGTTLTMSATGGTGWLWTGPNGFTSNQQSISIPNAQTTHSGNYAVTITGAGGCTLQLGTNIIVAYKAGTLDLDGVDDKVTVPVSSQKPSLNITNEITLESWIFPTDGTRQVQDVMCKSVNPNIGKNDGYIFPRTDDGWRSFVFYLHINGAWQKLSAPLPANPLNTWHHLAATYDGFYMRIYLNGTLAASQQISGSIALNNNDLVIGQQPGFTEFFKGKIEEARIWNRALNQCEIINNMTCEIDVTSSVATNGLAAYYKFNQGFVNQDNSAYTTLTDLSANANNGTLQNFALQGANSTWTDFQVSGTCTVLTDPPVTATANGSVFGIGSTIKLFANGGTNPISHTWDGPNAFTSFVQNPTITNAQPNESGVYTVTAKFVKCEVKASTRVTVSALRPISANGPTTFCPSSSVTLSSSNSGVAYQWYKNDVAIPGATTNAYVATQSGDYTVTVDDGRNILITVPLTITVIDNQAPQPVVAQLPVLTVEIPGANIPAVVSPSQYPKAIDNCSGTITAATTDPVSFNAVGTYSIIWTYDDRNGNTTQQTQQVNVVKAADNIPPVLNLPANQTLLADLATCGAIANFTATASDNSGYPVNITYSIASGSLFSTGNTIITVTATDAASNTTTGSFTVTVLPTVVAPVTGITNVCVGSATTLATASTGGAWSSSNPAVATVNATTGVVTGITPGSVTIIYTNQCGATASATVVVSILATPTITASGATTFCAPGTVVLTSGSATGNTWSTGEITQSITVNASGNYSVTVSNGICSATSAVVTVTVNPTPATPTITASGATTFCAPGSVILTSSAASGNTWSTTETTQAITVNTTGNYSVTVSNGLCSATSAVVPVTVNTAATTPTITVSGPTTFCAPGSVVLTSSSATGNTWSTNETTQSITVSVSGNYSVTVSNGLCSATSVSVPVTVNPTPATPIITANGPTTFCTPGTVVLTSSSATGNTWSNGATTQSITVSASNNYSVAVSNGFCSANSTVTPVTVNATPATPTITVNGATTFCAPGSVVLTSSSLAGNTWSTNEITESITVTTPGNYSVTVSNGLCSATSAVVPVTVNPTPATPIITASGSTTFCAPGSVVLTSSAATGNTWSTGETTQSITVSVSGNYSVTVSNGLCSATSAVTPVTVNPAVATPTITVSGATTFCAPGSVVLTSSAVTGNTWSTGATTQSITVSASGNYGVTVSNGNCAATSAPVPVTVHTVPAVPTITANGPTVFCAPGSVVLTSSAATGNTWSTGETTQSITVSISGNYSISATNGFCTSASSAAVTVTVNAAPAVPTITASGSTTFCAPGSVVLTSSAATGNTWSNGATTQSITVSTTGNYSVTVSNGLCSASSAAVAVNVNLLPAVSPITGNSSINMGATVQLSDNTPGGVWSSSNANATVNSTGLVTGVAAGTATISYTVTNNTGCSTTVTTDITINDVPVCNVLPVAIITPGSANTFCNNIVLTGSSSVSGATYKWVSGSAVIGTSQQITLDQSAGDGIYQLYVTANGCTSNAAVYNFRKQDLVNSYTILAYKEVEFDKYNKVVSGSVGVMSARGEAEFKSYSAVNGTGAFVKAPKIDKDGSGINIPNQIIGAATVTLPTMQFNTASTYNLPNYTATRNNANLSGNYKNLTVKRGVSVTVSGTTFGNIKLEEGANIRFLSSVLNIDNLTAYRGAKNTNYTYISFAPNTSVRVKSKVSIGSQVIVNPESNRVTFYMGDLSHDEEKFTVKGEDTRVIANVYMPDGKLRVTASKSEEEDHDGHGEYEEHDGNDDDQTACDHKAHNAKNCMHKGHDHNDCDHKAHDASNCGDNVYMTGLFIAEEVESKGNAVIWSNYDCSAAAPAIPTMTTVITVKQQVASETAETVTTQEELKITVMPNPSTTYFTLKLESKYQTPANLRVMDANGRVVDAKSKIASNSTFQIGHNYSSGTYYAELIQGTHRKVVQLIKVRG